MQMIRMIKTPLCDYKDCGSTAIYQFTDVDLDKNGNYKNKVVMGHSCEKHFDELRKKYNGKQKQTKRK